MGMTRYALDPTESVAWSLDPETDDLTPTEEILHIEVPDSVPEAAVVEAYERACEEFSDRDDAEAILEQLLVLLPEAKRVEKP